MFLYKYDPHFLGKKLLVFMLARLYHHHHPHRQHQFLSTTSPATAASTSMTRDDESEKIKIFIPEFTLPIKLAYMRRVAAEGETKALWRGVKLAVWRKKLRGARGSIGVSWRYEGGF